MLKCWKIQLTCKCILHTCYMFLKKMVTAQDFHLGIYHHRFQVPVSLSKRSFAMFTIVPVHAWKVLRKACGQRCFGTSGRESRRIGRGKMTKQGGVG